MNRPFFENVLRNVNVPPTCHGRVLGGVRVLARGGGGSESSESNDEEYTCKEESAVAPLFSINNRYERWCCGAFSLRFSNLRTQNKNRPFLVHVLIS